MGRDLFDYLIFKFGYGGNIQLPDKPKSQLLRSIFNSILFWPRILSLLIVEPILLKYRQFAMGNNELKVDLE